VAVGAWRLERGGWSVVDRGLADQRLLMQLYAPDDGRRDAQNTLSHI
jgi:hypothetical protein